MNKKTNLSMFVVDYMSGESFIHEFMSEKDFLELKKDEARGIVKIVDHTDLGIRAKA